MADSSTRRSRPCGAQSEGNVAPLTPVDRHTGRVGLDAPANNACLGLIDEAVRALPAGSREEKWPTPALDAREGGDEVLSGSSPAAADGGIPIFPRYSGNKCTDDTRQSARETWLRAVEERTEDFRTAKAQAHRHKAIDAALSGQPSRAQWHFARARGQRERFERVRECGEREILVTCSDCGNEGKRVEARCSQSRLCVKCRGSRATRYRCNIRAARARALRMTSHLRRFAKSRHRWRERFLTLTIPHSGDVARDIAAICTAWPRIRRKLWRFFVSEHGLSKALLQEIRFVRVLEITAGRINDGHAHFHVYFLSPYIPYEFVRHIWGEELQALGYATPSRQLADVLAAIKSDYRRQQVARVLTRKGGRPIHEVHWPVVDLIKCYGDVERELVKYLVKDAELKDGKLALIDPNLGAIIYQALEGVRTLATSRRFIMPDERVCFCEACGSTQVSRRLVKKPDTVEGHGSPSEADQPGAKE